MFIFTPSAQHCNKVLGRLIKHTHTHTHKNHKWYIFLKGRVKLSLVTDDMILYVKYPKEFTKKSTKAKKKSANLPDAKPTQKTICCLLIY